LTQLKAAPGRAVLPSRFAERVLPAARKEGDRRSLAVSGTVLIAVRDVVLADSLRFSLELEGYEARLCEPPIEPVKSGAFRACLLLDQDVFAAMIGAGDTKSLEQLGIPTVLMVNQQSQRLLDQALAAGVTNIVEKPLLGGVLLDAIRSALDGAPR
jgi:FixJ family two-component response regulator